MCHSCRYKKSTVYGGSHNMYSLFNTLNYVHWIPTFRSESDKRKFPNNIKLPTLNRNDNNI